MNIYYFSKYIYTLIINLYIYIYSTMSTFLEMQINKMSIDEINEILNSGIYISILKKEKLTERKKLLEDKDLSLSKHFPGLNNLEPEPEPEPEPETESKPKLHLKGAWGTKSTKILDGSNAPVVKHKSTLVKKKNNLHVLLMFNIIQMMMN